MSYRDRSLMRIFDTLTIHAVAHGISKSIIEQAKVFYKSISELKLTRGANRSGIIASSIYMSCKQEKVPRSAKEIAKIFNLSLPTMTRGCKRFQDLMEVDMEPTVASDFVGRYCSNLVMDKHKTDACKSLVAQVTSANVLSHNAPTSIAASCIFACSQEMGWGVSKKNVCDACDVSIVTISKGYKELQSFIRVLNLT